MKRDITINDLICNETLPIRVSWKKKLSGIYEKKEGSLVINRDKLKRMQEATATLQSIIEDIYSLQYTFKAKAKEVDVIWGEILPEQQQFFQHFLNLSISDYLNSLADEMQRHTMKICQYFQNQNKKSVNQNGSKSKLITKLANTILKQTDEQLISRLSLLLKMVKKSSKQIEKLYLHMASKFNDKQKRQQLLALYDNLDYSMLKFMFESDPSKKAFEQICKMVIKKCENQKKLQSYLDVFSTMKAVGQYQIGKQLKNQFNKTYDQLVQKYAVKKKEIIKIKQQLQQLQSAIQLVNEAKQFKMITKIDLFASALMQLEEKPKNKKKKKKKRQEENINMKQQEQSKQVPSLSQQNQMEKQSQQVVCYLQGMLIEDENRIGCFYEQSWIKNIEQRLQKLICSKII